MRILLCLHVLLCTLFGNSYGMKKKKKDKRDKKMDRIESVDAKRIPLSSFLAHGNSFDRGGHKACDGKQSTIGKMMCNATEVLAVSGMAAVFQADMAPDTPIIAKLDDDAPDSDTNSSVDSERCF